MFRCYYYYFAPITRMRLDINFEIKVCTTVDVDYSPVDPAFVLELDVNVPLTGEELYIVAAETVELDIAVAGYTVLVAVPTRVVKLEVVGVVVVVVVVGVVVVGVVVVGVVVVGVVVVAVDVVVDVVVVVMVPVGK